MATNLDTLTIQLKLDSRQFDRDLQQVTVKAEQYAKRIEKAYQKISLDLGGSNNRTSPIKVSTPATTNNNTSSSITTAPNNTLEQYLAEIANQAKIGNAVQENSIDQLSTALSQRLERLKEAIKDSDEGESFLGNVGAEILSDLISPLAGKFTKGLTKPFQSQIDALGGSDAIAERLGAATSDAIGEYGSKILDLLKDLPQSEKFQSLQKQLPPGLADKGKDLFKKAQQTIIPQIEEQFKNIPNTVDSFKQAIQDTTETLIDTINNLETIEVTAETVNDADIPGSSNQPNAVSKDRSREKVNLTDVGNPEVIKAVISKYFASLPNYLSDILDTSKSLKEAINTTVESVKTIKDTLSQDINSVQDLRERISEVITKLPTITAPIQQGVKEKAGQVINKGTEQVSSISKSILTRSQEIGESIVSGLEKGLATDEAVSKATEMAENMIEASRDTLEIKSPSKVYEEIGKDVVAGLNKGLTSNDVSIEDILEKSNKSFAELVEERSGDVNWDVFALGLDDAIVQQAQEGFDEVLGSLEEIQDLAQNAESLTPEQKLQVRQGIATYGIENVTLSDDIKDAEKLLHLIYDSETASQLLRRALIVETISRIGEGTEAVRAFTQRLIEANVSAEELAENQRRAREFIAERRSRGIAGNINDATDTVQQVTNTETSAIVSALGFDPQDIINRVKGIQQALVNVTAKTVAFGLGLKNLFKIGSFVFGKISDVVSGFKSIILDVGQNIDTYINTRNLETQFINAGISLQFARDKANELAISLEDISNASGLYSSLISELGDVSGQNVATGILEGLSNAGLGTEQTKQAITALSQIASKGVVSMEELRQQLGEAMPQAMQIASRSMGLTTRQFGELVSSGNLLATEFLPAFQAELQKSILPVEKLESTSIRLKNSFTELQSEIGKFALTSQAQLQKITGIEWLSENTDILKASILGLGITFVGMSVVSAAAAAKVLLSIKVINTALLNILGTLATLTTATLPWVAGIAIATAGITAFILEVNKARKTADSIKEVNKRINELNTSLDKTTKNAKKTRGVLGDLFNFRGFLDNQELNVQINAVWERGNELQDLMNNRLTQRELSLKVTEIKGLKEQEANLSLDIADAEKNKADVNVIADLKRQRVAIQEQIRDINKEINALPEAYDLIVEEINSKEFATKDIQVQTKIINQKETIEQAALIAKQYSKQANKIAQIEIDFTGFDQAERDLQELQRTLEATNLQANISGDLDIGTTVLQQQLQALRSSYVLMEEQLSKAKSSFYSGIIDTSVVTEIEKITNKKIDLLDLNDVEQALHYINELDNKSFSSTQEALEKYQTYLEKDNQLQDKKLEILNLQNQILEQEARQNIAKSTASSAQLEGQLNLATISNNLEAELLKRYSSLDDGFIDGATAVKNSILTYQTEVQKVNNLQTAITATYTTKLQQSLLKAANATDLSFSQFLASVSPQEIENLKQQLEGQIDKTPILGQFLDDISTFAESSIQAKEANLDLVSAQNNLIASTEDIANQLNDLESEIEDNVSQLEKSTAATALENQVLKVKNTLGDLIPAGTTGAMADLADFVTQANQAYADNKTAQLDFKSEVESNGKAIKELTDRYHSLIDTHTQLQSVLQTVGQGFQGALEHLGKGVNFAVDAFHNIAIAPATGNAPEGVYPVDNRNAPITSPYGERTVFGKRGHHDGIDIGVRGGTPVKAIFSGVVQMIKPLADQMQVLVRHTDKQGRQIDTWAIHLDKNLKVKEGQRVTAGQQLGTVAHTTAYARSERVSTGDHLDTRFYIDGNRIDPWKVLNNPAEYAPAIAAATVPAAAQHLSKYQTPTSKGISSPELSDYTRANAENEAEKAERLRLQRIESIQALQKQVDLNSIKAIRDREKEEKRLTDQQYQRNVALAEYGLAAEGFRPKTEGENFIQEQFDIYQEQLRNAVSNLGLSQDIDPLTFDFDTVDIKAKVDEVLSELPQEILDSIENMDLYRANLEALNQTYVDSAEAAQEGAEGLKEIGEAIDEVIRERAETEAVNNLDKQIVDNNLDLANRNPFATEIEKQTAQYQRDKIYLLQQEAEARAKIQALADEGLVSEETLGKMLEEHNSYYSERERLLDAQYSMIGQFGATIQQSLGTEMKNAFSSFFKGQKTAWEALQDMAIGVVEAIADKAAELLTNQIMNGFFGSGFLTTPLNAPSPQGLSQPINQQSSGSGILGGVLNAGLSLFGGSGGFGLAMYGGEVGTFSMGGEVGAYPMGGKIPYAMYGMAIENAMLGQKIREAMSIEGHGAMPIVAHKGEWVLSDKTGDAQLYESLRNSGEWNAMKGDVDKFKTGGLVGATSQREVPDPGRSRTYGRSSHSTVINNTYNVADYNSFNRSQEQMDRHQKARIDKAQKRR